MPEPFIRRETLNIFRYAEGVALSDLCAELDDNITEEPLKWGKAPEVRFPQADLELDSDIRPTAIMILGKREISRVYPSLVRLGEQALRRAIDESPLDQSGYPIRLDSWDYDTHGSSSHLVMKPDVPSARIKIRERDIIFSAIDRLAADNNVMQARPWNRFFIPDLSVVYFPPAENIEHLRAMETAKEHAGAIVSQYEPIGIDLSQLETAPFGDLLA